MDHTWYFYDEQHSTQSAAPAALVEDNVSYDIITLLALLQLSGTDMLPVHWHLELELLGKGGSALVNQSIIDRQTGFAFKRVDGGLDKEARMRALLLEIAILQTPEIRKHPNVSKLLGICWEIDHYTMEPSPVLVAEKAPLGDLKTFMASARGRDLSIVKRVGLCANIASAVKTLHKLITYIVHGDLKPENILIFPSENGQVEARVMDFGYSCYGQNLVKLPFSKYWAAPEWHDRSFTVSAAKKSDTFSYGLLCLFILFHDSGIGSLIRAQEFDADPFVIAFGSKLDLDRTAQEMILRGHELKEFEKVDLAEFVASCLHHVADQRNMSLSKLNRFGWQFSPEIDASLEVKFSIHDLQSHNFRLAPSLLQLAYADFRLRQRIVESLKAIFVTTEKLRPPIFMLNAAFTLAFCYSIGFGVCKNIQDASSWLQLSERGRNELEAEIEFAKKEFVKDIRSFQSPQFEELWVAGFVRTLDFSQLYRSRGNIELAKQTYRQEVEDLRTVFDEAHLVVLALKAVLSSILRGDGAWKEAEVVEEQILATRKEIFGKKHPETLSSMKAMVSIYHGLGRYADAEKTSKELLPLIEEVFGAENSMTLAAQGNLASTLLDMGQLKDAESLLLHVFEVEEKLAGHEHPDLMITMDNLSVIYSRQGRFKEAEEMALLARGISEKTFGLRHYLTTRIISNLAETYYDWGKFGQAHEVILPVVDLNRSMLGNEHPQTLQSLTILTMICMGRKHYEQAEILNRELLKVQKRLMGDRHLKTLGTLSRLAITISRQERYLEAEELFLEITSMNKTILGEDHPLTLESILNLARNYQGLEKWNSGETLVSKTIRHLQETDPKEESEIILDFMGQLSEIYRGQKRYNEARQLAEKVLDTQMQVLGRGSNATVLGAIRLASILDSMGLEEVEANAVRLQAIAMMRENGTLGQLYD